MTSALAYATAAGPAPGPVGRARRPAFEIRPLRDNHFGAEVWGLDPEALPEGAERQRLVDALHQHCILVFREVDCTPAQQLDIARLFGKLNIPAGDGYDTLPGHREIFVVANVMRDGKPIGAYGERAIWHADHSYRRVPSLGSLFRAIKLPTTPGWGTGFVDTYSPLAEMPAAWRERLARAWTLHDHEAYMRRYYPVLPYDEADRQAYPRLLQPVMRRHPGSGRTCLFLSGSTGIDLIGPDGKSLGPDFFQEVLAFATRPERQYEHAYRPGDMVLWDNRCTLHRPPEPQGLFEEDDPNARIFHRATVSGTEPAIPAWDAAAVSPPVPERSH